MIVDGQEITDPLEMRRALHRLTQESQEFLHKGMDLGGSDTSTDFLNYADIPPESIPMKGEPIVGYRYYAMEGDKKMSPVHDTGDANIPTDLRTPEDNRYFHFTKDLAQANLANVFETDLWHGKDWENSVTWFNGRQQEQYDLYQVTGTFKSTSENIGFIGDEITPVGDPIFRITKQDYEKMQELERYKDSLQKRKRELSRSGNAADIRKSLELSEELRRLSYF